MRVGKIAARSCLPYDGKSEQKNRPPLPAQAGQIHPTWASKMPISGKPEIGAQLSVSHFAIMRIAQGAQE